MSYVATSPNAYRQSAVLSATPGELVVMLYDGARRFLRQAAVAMRAREVERAHNAVRRAEMILVHLDGTLDRDQGELAENLHALYLFCLAHLARARMSQQAELLEQVSALLAELQEAWAQIAAETGGG